MPSIYFVILKVLIVAIGKQPSGFNRGAVKNISITTKQCKQLPPHSLPGTYSVLIVITFVH